MMEDGKRSRSQRDNDGDRKLKKRKNDELVVYRILCPDYAIGKIIGKSGEVIESIRSETCAEIKIVDPFPGAVERVITIYCYVKDKVNVEVDNEHECDEPLCAAQDALLRVHAAIASALSKSEVRILAPVTQTKHILGSRDATIKKIRSRTNATIEIFPVNVNEPTQSCAMAFDNFIVISGEADAVKKALYAISAIMYKFPPAEKIRLSSAIMDDPPTLVGFDIDNRRYSDYGCPIPSRRDRHGRAYHPHHIDPMRTENPYPRTLRAYHSIIPPGPFSYEFSDEYVKLWPGHAFF